MPIPDLSDFAKNLKLLDDGDAVAAEERWLEQFDTAIYVHQVGALLSCMPSMPGPRSVRVLLALASVRKDAFDDMFEDDHVKLGLKRQAQTVLGRLLASDPLGRSDKGPSSALVICGERQDLDLLSQIIIYLGSLRGNEDAEPFTTERKGDPEAIKEFLEQ